MLNKYYLDLENKDDILLSKIFLLKKKAQINISKIFFKMQTKAVLNMSNTSNSRVFLLFLSFFYLFFVIDDFSIIKGSQKRILFFQFFIKNFYSHFFLSLFYYFSKFSDLNDFLYSKYNNISGQFFIFFSFVVFQNFLQIYSTEEQLLDIVEENFLITMVNKF